MNKIKMCAGRFFGIGVGIIVLGLMMAGGVGAAPSTTISIASQTVSSDESVTMPIIAYNITNLAAYTVSLTYNPAVVVVESVGAGDLGGGSAMSINNVTGVTKISSFSTTPQSGNVTLANVVLRAVATSGTSSLNITVITLSDNNFNKIPADIISGTITVTGGGTGSDTVGIYRNGSFYLRNNNSAGNADLSFIYGMDGDIPLVGDWNGDGKDTVGIYRHGSFYLKNNNSAGSADLSFVYGVDGDIPLVGDWNGDGKDTVGIYRHGSFYLKNNNSAGSADLSFVYGVDGDIPLVGDWNGDGTDTVGIYRNGSFYLRNNNSAGNADLSFIYGISGDTPLVGDWNSDGKDTIGIYRHGSFYLRNNNSAGNADLSFMYGIDSDTPLVGDWTGT
ncbi:MAG: cohesin domain-containing protein [Candidatus Methanoperedens sp.]|nr:cohesin domain-containing protein [Candidatus Methanoperedens sp.]